MIEPLGAWVLQEACRQAAAWRAQFPEGPVLGITVNVSAKQLTRPNFLEIVQRAAGDARLCPGDLRLEITETALMDNPEQAAWVLHELRALGVRVYLDDFGTGFSSLSYLHRFPVDTLKIDRSFVASLAGRDNQPAIIESIVALARTLGTHVIAEGVETTEQMDELIRLGCGQAQGFLFSSAAHRPGGRGVDGSMHHRPCPVPRGSTSAICFPCLWWREPQAPGGDERRRPRPLKIEASDSAVDVEHLADQIEPRAEARFHRGGIDLVERHSARGRLGVVVPATAADG